MEDIDVDKFISLTKAKESIWKYKSTAYADETQRRNDWISVCQAMVPDFEEKTNEEKNDIVLQHQVKWRELREGFERSVENEKLEQEKLYLYCEKLHFLHDLYGFKTMVGQSNSNNISQRKPRRKHYDGELSQDNTEVKENNDESAMEEDKHFLLSLLNDFRMIPDDQKLNAKGDILEMLIYYRRLQQFDARGAHCVNCCGKI